MASDRVDFFVYIWLGHSNELSLLCSVLYTGLYLRGVQTTPFLEILKIVKFNVTVLHNISKLKIMKIVATRCCIFRLPCTKFNFSWGSTTDPVGELTALPQMP